MPWLGDDICMKDSQALPGLSLVQWMNMQQNPALANSMQPNFIQSGSVMQNFAGADLSRQMGFSTPQVPHPNNLELNVQRLPQQVQQLDQLPKLPSTMNPGSIMQPQHLGDMTQQSRQNVIAQTLPCSQVQAQVLQPQTLVQSNSILQQQQASTQTHQLLSCLPQNLQQQQHLMSPNQQQNLMHSQLLGPVNQHLQMPDNQVQFQLLQKLQQQQQTLLAQQSPLQQSAQLAQPQDQQKQLVDSSQSFAGSVITSQALEMPQLTPTLLPQSNVVPQHMSKINSKGNVQLSQPFFQSKLQQQQPGMLPEIPGHMGVCPSPTTINQLPTTVSGVMTGAAVAAQSAITDDNPSCSTSPSTNCQNILQPTLNSRVHRSTGLEDDMAQSAARLLNPNALETMSSNTNIIKELQQKSDVKPSNISRSQNQGLFAPQNYINSASTQADYLDTSSSTTSVCLSQNDVHLQRNNSLTYNPQIMLLRETNQDGEFRADPRNNVPYGANVDGQIGMPNNSDTLLTKGMMGLGKDFSNFSSGGMHTSYENPKDAQQELSSSMVSQSFGVPDMTFNSIDSTINDSSFINQGTWPPPPQFQRMRTYTKVCCSKLNNLLF